VGEAGGTGGLHNAGDEERQPGQREAADERGDGAHGLHVGGGARRGAAPRQPCLLHFPDLLHVHGGNLQHVAVEVNEEQERWEEAGAEDGERVGRVEDPEEGALLLGGDLKGRVEDREEADGGSNQPEPHQAHADPQARHQLEIVERLPDGQVPVPRNQEQRQDRGSGRAGHESHSQDAEDLGRVEGLGKLVYGQPRHREADHGIRDGEVKDEIEPLGAGLLDEAKESDGHQRVGGDDERGQHSEDGSHGWALHGCPSRGTAH